MIQFNCSFLNEISITCNEAPEKGVRSKSLLLVENSFEDTDMAAFEKWRLRTPWRQVGVLHREHGCECLDDEQVRFGAFERVLKSIYSVGV